MRRTIHRQDIHIYKKTLREILETNAAVSSGKVKTPRCGIVFSQSSYLEQLDFHIKVLP